MSGYWPPLLGGMLLGLAAVMLLLLNGRIAGISGILGRLLGGGQVMQNASFLVGLLCGPLLYALVFGGLPPVTVAAAWPLLAVAGLFVGIGTRMGSGCTSGHGVLGLARFSRRSLAATACFLGAGIVTATLMGFLR